VDRQRLESFLKESVNAASLASGTLEFQVTDSAETGNISSVVTVRFAKDAGEAILSLNRLVDRLKEQTVVAAVDAFGPPASEVAVHGATDGINYKIVIKL